MSVGHIRTAAPNDSHRIAAIHGKCFSPSWNEAAISALLNHGGRGWMLAKDRQDTGFILTRSAADEVELLSIAVLPEVQGKGLATFLLEYVCQQLTLTGVKQMFLEVASDNMAARQLYEKNGFISIGKRERYYANGADALTFRRALG